MRRRLAPLTIALALGLTVGCGGGDSVVDDPAPGGVPAPGTQRDPAEPGNPGAPGGYGSGEIGQSPGGGGSGVEPGGGELDGQ